MTFRVLAALAVAALIAAPRPGLAAEAAGEVVSFNGECYVQSGDQRSPLKVGDTIHVGDVIEVPEAARLRLTMADGSVVSLASGSQLTVESYEVTPDGDRRAARLRLGNGLFRAVVSKPKQPAPFEVDTPTGLAAARNTDWFVEAAPDTTRVSVLDGTVALGKPGATLAAAVTIPPQSTSEATAKAPPSAPQHVGKAEFARLKARTQVRYGWCQCISDLTVIRAACDTGTGSCKAGCGGGNYSFVPDARLSCSPYYADPVPQKPPRPGAKGG
jgi:hypothetical protein